MKTKETALKLTALAALVLLTTACGGGGGGGATGTPTDPGTSPVAQVEFQSFQLVNSERSARSIDPELQLRERLSDVARSHSRSMRDNGFFAHQDPSNGASLRDRLNAAGISFRAASENIARVSGAGDPAGWAHGRLMDSPRHRKNILSRDYDVVGVGVSQRGNEYWITQVFIKR